MNDVAALLAARDILLGVDAADRFAMLERIAEHMEWVHGLAQRTVQRSLEHREQIGSTAIGHGVAVPHARIADLNRVVLSYVRLLRPVAYDAPDGQPVTHALVILVPKVAAEEHLQVLAQTSQMFSDSRFREQLMQCRHPAEAKQAFDGWSRPLF